LLISGEHRTLRVLTPYVIKLVHETIYALIGQNRLNKGLLFTYLRRKGIKRNYRKGKITGRGVIPNRTDISQRPSVFTTVTHEEVARIGWILNSRPRKSLHYKTPAEVVISPRSCYFFFCCVANLNGFIFY